MWPAKAIVVYFLSNKNASVFVTIEFTCGDRNFSGEIVVTSLFYITIFFNVCTKQIHLVNKK